MHAAWTTLTRAGAVAGTIVGCIALSGAATAQQKWVTPAPIAPAGGAPSSIQPPATGTTSQPATTPARPPQGLPARPSAGQPTWVQPTTPGGAAPGTGSSQVSPGGGAGSDEAAVRRAATSILSALRANDAAGLQRHLSGARAGDPRASLDALLGQARGAAHNAIHASGGELRAVFIDGNRASAVFCKAINEVFALELERSGNEWKLSEQGISRFSFSNTTGAADPEGAARATAQSVLTALRSNDAGSLQRHLSGARAGDPREALRAALDQSRGAHEAIHEGGGMAQGVFIEGNRATVMFCKKVNEMFAVQLEREGPNWKLGDTVIARFVQQ